MENRQTNQKSASANFRALHIPFRKYMIVAVYSQPLVRKNQKFEKVLKNKLQVIFEITAFRYKTPSSLVPRSDSVLRSPEQLFMNNICGQH